MLARLLEADGSTINIADSSGTTPLHSASRNYVSVLLRYRPDIHARDSRSFTALHNALAEGDLDIVKALLEAGARAGDTCENGCSCLELAAVRNDGKNLLEVLLQWQDNAKEEFWDTGDRIAAIWKAYLNRHFHNITYLLKEEKDRSVTNSRSPEGHTLLESALLDGWWYEAKDFLDCGVDPFLRNASDGLSAFELTPMLPPGSLRIEIFQCCLDKLGTNISVLGDGFRAVRAVLELGGRMGQVQAAQRVGIIATG